MLSYVLSSNSFRNYPLYILHIKNNMILTTIPQNEKELVFFEKDSIHILSHQSDTYLFQFKARFVNTRTIDKTTYYLLELLEVTELKNIRTENRNAVHYPASFIYKDAPNPCLGCVVDISENGLKLETSQPISSNKIHIMFDDASSKKYKIVKVMWNSKKGNKYYYGLKSIVNF